MLCISVLTRGILEDEFEEEKEEEEGDEDEDGEEDECSLQDGPSGKPSTAREKPVRTSSCWGQTQKVKSVLFWFWVIDVKMHFKNYNFKQNNYKPVTFFMVYLIDISVKLDFSDKI